MPRRGAIGGAAGEQGSRHRNGVAAYFAVYGLVGLPVQGRPNAVPKRLQLEADEDVDDIVCEMEDGSHWYLQSKRVAGKNKATKAAIKQWIGQSLKSADRVGLVSRELQGLLRNLQQDIDQWIKQRASLGETAKKRIDEFSGFLEEEGVTDSLSMIKQVILIECAVESLGDSQYENAIALLSGNIVHAMDAGRAFEALRNHMQHTASRRESCGPEDWLEALRSAGIPVIADPEGAYGARLEAEAKALRQYRQFLFERLDMLDLSALRPGLGHVHVPGLLRGWKVTLEKIDRNGTAKKGGLWEVARRNRRFVLTGLPGIGKSEALRQIAAKMAGDDSAPLPIHVDLRDLVNVVQRSEDVTLGAILSRSSRSPHGSQPEFLAGVLQKAVEAGNAVLIVDGLDEARNRRGIVAEGLNQLLNRLPLQTGFILSTRPSAMDALGVLGLPAVELQSPDRLGDSLREVLKALAKDVSEQRREAWLTSRLSVLERVSKESREIWMVPLLATLATIRMGSPRPFTSAAVDLLYDVVDDSVQTWEVRKEGHAEELDDEIRPEMLLEAFKTIGQLLSDSATLSRQTAENLIRDDLASWNVSPKLAPFLAKKMVHFWDERVGIFVDQDGYLIPRSRLFAELAKALWLETQSESAKEAWLTEALADPDSRQTVLLSSSKDPYVRKRLIDLARRGVTDSVRSQALSWLLQFWGQWPAQNEASVSEIINVLADAAEDLVPEPVPGDRLIDKFKRGRNRRDGDGWACVIALANADIPNGCRSERDERIRKLRLSDERRQLADLIINLHKAKRSGRRLSETERTAILDLLNAAQTTASVPRKTADGASSWDVSERSISGVGIAIVLAVDHFEELGDGAPEAFFALAGRLSMDAYEQVAAVLNAKGFQDSERFAGLRATMSAFADGLSEEYKEFYGAGWILRVLVEVFKDDATQTVHPDWRYIQVADFLTALDWNDASFDEARAAAEADGQLLRAWFAATAEAFGLQPSLLAAQAGSLLTIPDEDRAPYARLLLTDSLESAEMSLQIGCETAVSLVSGFCSGSEWMANEVFGLVIDAGCSDLSEGIAKIQTPMTWRERFLATIVGITNASITEEAIVTALQGDSATRSAVAAILPDLALSLPEITKALAADKNATVLYYAGLPAASASVWTCTHCYRERSIDDTICSKCNRRQNLQSK